MSVEELFADLKRLVGECEQGDRTAREVASVLLVLLGALHQGPDAVSRLADVATAQAKRELKLIATRN